MVGTTRACAARSNRQRLRCCLLGAAASSPVPVLPLPRTPAQPTLWHPQTANLPGRFSARTAAGLASQPVSAIRQKQGTTIHPRRRPSPMPIGSNPLPTGWLPEARQRRSGHAERPAGSRLQAASQHPKTNHGLASVVGPLRQDRCLACRAGSAAAQGLVGASRGSTAGAVGPAPASWVVLLRAAGRLAVPGWKGRCREVIVRSCFTSVDSATRY